MVIYRDPDVKFGRDTTGGIRISQVSHIDSVRRVVVPVSRQRYKEYTIEPLILADAPPPPDPTDAQNAARAAASNGKAAFTEWWKSNKGNHALVMDIMDQLKELTAMADAQPAPDAGGDYDDPPI